ncbi:MAG TPA: DUF5335 family protein [Thermoanaerobaculia bacterium]|nr:DUF5335 family protein [Thermoanaerobaculia bacterium]
MSKTREIPRQEWPGFLDAFSRSHEGDDVRTEVFGRDFGAQEESEHLPLMGITADFKDVGGERITIALGRSPEDHVSHAVVRPTRILLLEHDDGADEALEIESADGAPTLLRLVSRDGAGPAGGSADRKLEGARSNSR